MVLIEDYGFGRIKIGGKVYKNDLKIVEGKIIPEWWRRQGHKVFIEDIEDILNHDVEVVVLGQGESGMMKADGSLREYLKNNNIKLIEKPTREAVLEFNKLIKDRKRVGAGFHLTC